MIPRAGLRAALIAVFSTAACSLAWATVTASVDRDQLAAGDTVQLTLQSDHGSGQPDLAPLAQDFDILGRSSGSSVQIVNGHMSSQQQVVLTLAPKHGGQVTVPALQWDGEQSAPIVLTVAANGGAGSGNSGPGGSAPNNNASAANGVANSATNSAAHVFLTSTLDPPNPYVQAAVTLTVRLYSDEALDQASLALTGNGDVLVQQIGQDVQTEENRNGHSYQVVERRYVLFPQRSGTLKLDGPVLDAQVEVAGGNGGIDPFFGRAFSQLQLPSAFKTVRPLRLHGDPITLTVRPRPASMANTDWLPAQQLTLGEDWQAPAGGVPVGQPVTRHLHLAAVGLSAAQLPDLSALMPLPAGLKAYPDQAKLVNGEQSGRIVGQRDQDIALLADHPGHYEIPALHLSWWDTAANQRREVVLPARSLDIVAGSGSAATNPPPAALKLQPATPAQPAPSNEPPAAPPHAPTHLLTVGNPAAASPWAWVSLALGGLWLATLGAWGWTSRGHRGPNAARPPAPASSRSTVTTAAPAFASAAAARRALLQACQRNAARAAREAALAWGRQVWPGQPINGLNALARRLGDSRVTPLLRELDQACIADTAWSGALLAQVWPLHADADTNTGGEAAAQGAAALPGLYGGTHH